MLHLTMLTAAASVIMISAAADGETVHIHPTAENETSAQRVLNSHPEPGTNFLFRRGLHEVGTLRPLDGQLLFGEAGTISQGR
jgi:hypothetical protein